MKKQVLTISEAAEILGVSDETLRIWERAGKLTPSYTEGGHRRYQRVDIEKIKSNNMEIKFGLHPLRYGNDNITDAFVNKQVGFELELRSDNLIFRKILSLDDTVRLKDNLELALKNYEEFKQFTN
jgi:excisionase family DNA binding protein